VAIAFISGVVTLGARKPLVVDETSTSAELFGELVPTPILPLLVNLARSTPLLIKAIVLGAGLEKPVFSDPSPKT
jgi:hypothetical protein